MNRSSVHFISGLLATVAAVTQIARSVFFALEGYRLLTDKLGMSVKAFGYVNLAFNTIIWGLFAAAFFILINDKRNIRSALLGGISCVISVVATAVCILACFSHWSFNVIWFFLYLVFSLAVVILKTSVPSGVRIATIIGVGIGVLLDVGWQGANIYSQFNGWEKVSSFYNVYGKIATWTGILCWVMLAVHYIFQTITSKYEREDTGNILPARDAFCTTCGARIHFPVNQNQVVCGNCGVPSLRGATEANQQATNRVNANHSPTRLAGDDSSGSASIRRATLAETMELVCPNCGEKCEVPTTIVNGQHLLCPYCNEKFAYHS